jgi:hypothetical protein
VSKEEKTKSVPGFVACKLRVIDATMAFSIDNTSAFFVPSTRSVCSFGPNNELGLSDKGSDSSTKVVDFDMVVAARLGAPRMVLLVDGTRALNARVGKVAEEDMERVAGARADTVRMDAVRCLAGSRGGTQAYMVPSGKGTTGVLPAASSSKKSWYSDWP